MWCPRSLDVDRLGHYALDEVGHVHGHLVDLRRVVLLDVAEDPDVVRLDEVDGDALAAEAARAADAVDIQLAVVGQVVVDDERDLRQRGGRRAEAGWVQSCG